MGQHPDPLALACNAYTDCALHNNHKCHCFCLIMPDLKHHLIMSNCSPPIKISGSAPEKVCYLFERFNSLIFAQKYKNKSQDSTPNISLG